ncbi:VUT family protein [Neorhizobium galegae]|uniref:VUT family protein n=1 Tax=Neorhizobium galegae TaxID=399 RepID=UPI000620EF99|nr:Membrane protein containing DUF165 [Neorhizobium galegae bv. orientalis]
MRLSFLFLLAFIATIPAANWLISHVGACIPNGPCLIPVGFDLAAPSGVLMAGLALVLRDVVHERFGAKIAIAAIGVGAALSVVLAPPALAVASAAAFLLSELADLAVYAPLRERRLYLAVLLSGVVGSIVDSAVFLLLAFGSLDFIAGQVLGKVWMTLAVLPLFIVIRNVKGAAQ